MTDSPVIFRPACDDREIAMLGVLEVGEIGRYDAGMAYWRLWLPGCVAFGRAAHPRAAREYLTAKAEQWIEAAGLVANPRPEIRAFRPDDRGKIKQAVRP
jgi:hypothetical protein